MNFATFRVALTWTLTAAAAAEDQNSSLERNLDSITKEATIHNGETTIENPLLPPPPPEGHVTGGLPIISDAAFSLVILIYVSIAFCFVFFMFCWKSESNNNKGFEHQCILMTNNISDPSKANFIAAETHVSKYT